MLDRTTTEFSHVKPTDTAFAMGGLRDFFLYRDLGVAEATHGKVIAHLVKANLAPEKGASGLQNHIGRPRVRDSRPHALELKRERHYEA